MTPTDSPTPRVLSRPEHGLSRKQISGNAVKVLYRLHRAGYVAYLVGGGVRDLLLGLRPKDFDVATNARPEEIRRLFSNSRIIGRRFRLVHVFFRGEIVEVSTFRANPEPPEGPDDWEEGDLEEQELQSSDDPLPKNICDDNTFGTPEEDSWRRDLTVNSLFYDIADFSVIDWVGGLEDLKRRVIRIVGPPQRRFEEDPVRMMRALEYLVRLDFELAPETEEAIREGSDLISEAAPARLTYELMEGLRSGHSSGIWEKWREFGLIHRAFPELIESPDSVPAILDAIDRRLAAGHPINDASILASLFLPRFVKLVLEMASGPGGRLDNVKFMEGLKDLLEPASTRMMISNRTLHLMFHGLFTLTKMRRAPERGRQVIKLSRHESFGVAWDLFEIGVSVGLLPRESLRAWASALEQVRKGSEAVAPNLSGEDVPKPRRRRRKRRPRSAETNA